MRQKFLFFSLSIALTCSTHAAENNIRPGLWELSATSNLLALAEQIPPDQLRNLDNLARQYGFEMPKIKNGAASSKVCVTREMAEQNIPPSAYHRQSGCETRNATRIDNRYSADLVCTGEQVSGQGRTEATLTTSESFTGHTRFKGVVRGIAIDEQANTSGRWINADCGTVKAQ